MSLIFYGAPMSTATITEIVLAELDIPHEKKVLDTKAGQTRTPEFLAINPNGLVPTIVHDGVAIWESSAITIYLGETFGTDKKLWPAPGPHRGEAMMWVVWTNVRLGDAMYRRGRASGQMGPDHPKNDQLFDVASKDLGNLLAILDKHLEGKQFLVGEYSLADTHLQPLCDWIKFSQVDFTPYANITAWSSRCAARPGYQKVMGAYAG